MGWMKYFRNANNMYNTASRKQIFVNNFVLAMQPLVKDHEKNSWFFLDFQKVVPQYIRLQNRDWLLPEDKNLSEASAAQIKAYGKTIAKAGASQGAGKFLEFKLEKNLKDALYKVAPDVAKTFSGSMSINAIDSAKGELTEGASLLLGGVQGIGEAGIGLAVGKEKGPQGWDVFDTTELKKVVGIAENADAIKKDANYVANCISYYLFEGSMKVFDIATDSYGPWGAVKAGVQIVGNAYAAVGEAMNYLKCVAEEKKLNKVRMENVIKDIERLTGEEVVDIIRALGINTILKWS